jgi:hypothetical protein
MCPGTILDLYKWKLKNDWTPHEQVVIEKVGQDIHTYVDGLTGGKGLAWINKFLVNVKFSHRELSSLVLPANPHVLPCRTIVLPADWDADSKDTLFNPYQRLAHELGHVWDNATNHGVSVYLGGGASDDMNESLGGNIKKKSFLVAWRWRFYNPNERDYLAEVIPDEVRWSKLLTYYGNGATTDYFAEAFSWNIYYKIIFGENHSPVPTEAASWIVDLIRQEAVELR